MYKNLVSDKEIFEKLAESTPYDPRTKFSKYMKQIR